MNQASSLRFSLEMLRWRVSSVISYSSLKDLWHVHTQLHPQRFTYCVFDYSVSCHLSSIKSRMSRLFFALLFKGSWRVRKGRPSSNQDKTNCKHMFQDFLSLFNSANAGFAMYRVAKCFFEYCNIISKYCHIAVKMFNQFNCLEY